MSQSTILVIEDERTLGELLVYNLKKEGYEVQHATDGQDGLRRAQTWLPDLVILDLMLPVIEGLEVCRQLKANPATAQIPVIFLTAKSDSEDEALGLAMGAVDYITKPVSPAIAMARIGTHMSLYRHKQRIKETFGQYVDPRIVENLITGRPDNALSGEKQVAFDKGAEYIRFSGTVNPDTILNGRQLDLFNLYKEVVKRGGIRYVASHSADGNE